MQNAQGGPVPRRSSCFSASLAVSCSSCSLISLSCCPDRWSHLVPYLSRHTPSWRGSEEPRLLAWDHVRRYGPASMHRHNGEAPSAPRRSAERLQASGRCRSSPSKGATAGVLSFSQDPGKGPPSHSLEGVSGQGEGMRRATH